MKRYWAYGLTVASEHPFPELLPLNDEGPYDVQLNWQQEVDWREEINVVETNSQDTSFYYHVPGTALYTAQAGKAIDIRPVPGADYNKIRLFCLSNAFAAILHQRNMLPMHCGACVHDHELVVIAGDSGAGKSTLLMELNRLGLPTFSDDVCVPHRGEGNQLKFYGSYPVRKLWHSEREKFDNDSIMIRSQPDGRNKYAVPMANEFIACSMKPKVVFFMTASTNPTVSIRELEGVEKFRYWESNSYRGEFYTASDLQHEHFRLISDLAGQIKAFSIERPHHANTAAQLANEVLGILEELKSS